MDEGRKIERSQPAGRAAGEERRTPLDRNGAAGTEEGLNLLAYWWVVRRRYRTVLATFFSLLFVVLIGTLLLKPIYRAEALLEIAKEDPDIPTVGELFALGDVSPAHLETQYKILQSTSLARTVIEQLNLSKLPEFNPPSLWPWSKRKDSKLYGQNPAARSLAGIKPDRKTYQKTLENFMERLSVSPVRRSRLIQVSFESYDAELAARVVNTLTANFIEQDLEARSLAAQEAFEWLTGQLASAKARLEKSEEELQAYVRKNGLQFLDAESSSENIVNRRLSQLQAELASAERARHEKESFYGLVEAGDYGSLPRLYQNAVLEDLLTIQLAGLKRELAQLTATSSPEAPQVKRIQSQIDETEKLLARERERVIERITSDYRAAVRREELVGQAFEEEQVRARRISEKLVQYNILRREVETNKSLYTGLLGNLRRTAVSADWSASSIRIVDSAEPPWKPTRPRILLNLALAAVLGLGLGVGGAFLQEYAAGDSGRVELSDRIQSS